MRPRSFKQFPTSALEGSIVDRFRQQVAEHAKQTAVRTGSVDWSYAEVDSLSNRIANRLLREFGEQIEPIAVTVNQGALAVVTILGTIKAGKIYVPLDLTEPGNSISAKLENAAAQGILTDAANRDKALEFRNQIRSVVEAEQAIEKANAADPSISIDSKTPVYIFYTSGSTGPPKGVFDSHRNVLHNVLRYTNTLEIGSDDGLSLIQSPSFSGTVSSLFAALLNGATICPFDIRTEGVSALSHCIRSEKLTIFHSVPSIFEQLVETGDRFPSLRVIRLEGDQAFKRHIMRFQENFMPPCILVNGLGATETGLTRQFFIETNSIIPGSTVPIGFATPDMETLLLSPDGQEVPTGEVGEIAIRSRYLACGYWRRPDLTNRAFMPCPIDPTKRIYRSGDLGSFDENGCLTHLGRRDFRVKVRGQWIDLESIQETVTSRTDVASAVVVSVDGAERESKIVAYVVADESSELTANTLRRSLAADLPWYMVPENIVFLEAMPLDSNGKIARKDLPSPDAVHNQEESCSDPICNDLEMTLAQCWSQVLKQDDIGRNDIFFDLGGDSLQAIELLQAIEKTLGRHLPRSILLEADTIAKLAERIELLAPTPCLVPIQSKGDRPAFFCVHDLNGEVLNFRALAYRLGADQPFFGIQSVGLDRQETPLVRVEDMAKRYIAEVCNIQATGPYYIGGYSMGGWIAYEMAQQLREAGHTVELLALFDTHSRQGRRRVTPSDWLRRHRWRLSRLELSAVAPYVALRFHNFFEIIYVGVRQRLFAAAWRFSNRVLRRSPNFLHSPIDANTLAIRSYRPHPYDGDAVLFKASPYAWTHTDAYEGWRLLIGGDLEIRSIAGPHSDILEEPHVQNFARALAECLNKRNTAAPKNTKFVHGD